MSKRSDEFRIPLSPEERERKNNREKERKKIREKARQLLPQLLTEYNHRCYWCRRKVVMRRAIPDHLIVQETDNEIIWRTSPLLRDDPNIPEVLSALIASVDHLTRIADGGGNARDNLVPSCRACNNTRADHPVGVQDDPD
jgi:5-methylcytosine-specific restriction endonuclease McrA